jgi:hypothetical protein
VHHLVAALYLDAYAAEMAWRESHLRVSSRKQYTLITGAVLNRVPSIAYRLIQALTKQQCKDGLKVLVSTRVYTYKPSAIF